MKYEIQQYTICDDWINTWSIEEGGVLKPLVLDSKEEAQKDLDDFLREIVEEIEYGEREPENSFDTEYFRIEAVKDN